MLAVAGIEGEVDVGPLLEDIGHVLVVPLLVEDGRRNAGPGVRESVRLAVPVVVGTLLVGAHLAARDIVAHIGTLGPRLHHAVVDARARRVVLGQVVKGVGALVRADRRVHGHGGRHGGAVGGEDGDPHPVVAHHIAVSVGVGPDGGGVLDAPQGDEGLGAWHLLVTGIRPAVGPRLLDVQTHRAHTAVSHREGAAFLVVRARDLVNVAAVNQHGGGRVAERIGVVDDAVPGGPRRELLLGHHGAHHAVGSGRAHLHERQFVGRHAGKGQRHGGRPVPAGLEAPRTQHVARLVAHGVARGVGRLNGLRRPQLHAHRLGGVGVAPVDPELLKVKGGLYARTRIRRVDDRGGMGRRVKGAAGNPAFERGLAYLVAVGFAVGAELGQSLDGNVPGLILDRRGTQV